MSKELTKTDRELLKYADRGWSPEQIGQKLNLPAGEVALRVKAILDGHDWLGILERQKMNLMSLEAVKGQLQERAQNPRADVKEIEAFVRATEVMHRLITEGTSLTEDQINAITVKQAQGLLKLMVLAWDKAIRELEVRYPDIDLVEITEIYHKGLREGAEELDAG